MIIGKTTEWSLDKLYSSFRDAYHEFQQMTKKYDGLEAEIGYVREDIGQKKTACEAFDKIVGMYQSQIEQVDKVLNEILLKKNQAISSTRLLAASIMPMLSARTPSPSRQTGQQPAATTHDSTDDVEQTQRLMNSNRDKLKQRVDDLQKKRDDVRTEIDYLSKILSQLQEELDMLRPELIELRKKRENYHMWLLQRGENDDKIQARLKGSQSSSFLIFPFMLNYNKTYLILKEDIKNMGNQPSDAEANQMASLSTGQLKSSSSMQNLETLTGDSVMNTSNEKRKSSESSSDFRVPPETLPISAAVTTAATASSTVESPASASNIYETTAILYTSSSSRSDSHDKDPHANSLNWYLPDCDRDQAYKLLSHQPNGAYLVRPNLKQLNPKYILSLVHENQVKHILIEEDPTGCFIKSNFSIPDRHQNRLPSLGKLSNN